MERELYYYEYIDSSYEKVRAVVQTEAASFFQVATDRAAEAGRTVQTELTVKIAGLEVGRKVTIELGEIERKSPLTSVLPLSWQSSEAAGLFPNMKGELELTKLSAEPPLTQISFLGSYTPPLGALGAAGDAMWGHRVAEATVHRFVRELKAQVTEAVAKP